MRRLMRSKKDRMIAGICGGLGEYFDIDPTLIRLGVLVGLVFSAGALIFAYIVAMFVVPLEN